MKKRPRQEAVNAAFPDGEPEWLRKSRKDIANMRRVARRNREILATVDRAALSDEERADVDVELEFCDLVERLTSPEMRRRVMALVERKGAQLSEEEIAALVRPLS